MKITAKAQHYLRSAWYYMGNIIKYLYRYPKKGGSKDIRKAIKCLEELAALVEAHERG